MRETSNLKFNPVTFDKLWFSGSIGENNSMEMLKPKLVQNICYCVRDTAKTIEEIADIKTAVSEAVTNCIIHGYENSEGIIKIHCMLKDNSIIIEISDSGVGIEDINIAKEPLFTSKPNLERSGMGFTIMQSFMDDLKVESVINLGTKITMKKTIKQNISNNNNQSNICITA